MRKFGTIDVLASVDFCSNTYVLGREADSNHSRHGVRIATLGSVRLVIIAIDTVDISFCDTHRMSITQSHVHVHQNLVYLRLSWQYIQVRRKTFLLVYGDNKKR